MTDAGYDPAAASNIFEYFDSYAEQHMKMLYKFEDLKEEDAEKRRKHLRDINDLMSTPPSVS
jgi:hypothetical protein